MSTFFGLGLIEIAILLLMFGLPAMVIVVVLLRQPKGPSAGQINDLLAENEDLRDEIARLKKQLKGEQKQ